MKPPAGRDPQEAARLARLCVRLTKPILDMVCQKRKSVKQIVPQSSVDKRSTGNLSCNLKLQIVRPRPVRQSCRRGGSIHAASIGPGQRFGRLAGGASTTASDGGKGSVTPPQGAAHEGCPSLRWPTPAPRATTGPFAPQPEPRAKTPWEARHSLIIRPLD